MNQLELITTLSRNTNLTNVQAKEAVIGILKVMKDTLLANESIALSKFGVFHPKFCKSRKGRNPQTGEIIFVPAKRSIKFKVSNHFENQLRGNK